MRKIIKGITVVFLLTLSILIVNVLTTPIEIISKSTINEVSNKQVSTGTTQTPEISEKKVYIDSILSLSLKNILKNEGIPETMIDTLTSITFNDYERSGVKIEDFDIEVDLSNNSNETLIIGIKGVKLYFQYAGTFYFRENSSHFFSYMTTIKEIAGLEYTNPSEVTDMSSMFYRCRSLMSVDLSSWDTSNVTDMSYMFWDCLSLETLDLNSFNTGKVTDMSYMFYFRYDSKLRNLYISEWDTSNVIDMSYMFHVEHQYGESLLTELDLSNWDTRNVLTMQHMFYNLHNLEMLDLSNFVTSKLTNMSMMFSDMEKLKKLDISNFDTSKVTNMYFAFGDMHSLEELNLENFDTSNVTDMQGMFIRAYKLERLNLSNFTTANVTAMNWMFKDMTNLKELDISNFTINETTNVSDILGNDTKLQKLIVNDFGENITIELPIEMYDQNMNAYTTLNSVTEKTTLLRKHKIIYDNLNIYKEILYGNNYGELMNPVMEGRIFKGWYSDKELTSRINENSVFLDESDITIYAKWEMIKYNITFLDEDGSILKETTEYDYGTLAKDIAIPQDPS